MEKNIKMTYEEAVARLEEIVRKIEGNEYDIDAMSEVVKEAKDLVKFCRDKLYKTDEEIKKLLVDREEETK
jgi:exodeoxyribonuclease VII small subunit